MVAFSTKIDLSSLIFDVQVERDLASQKRLEDEANAKKLADRAAAEIKLTIATEQKNAIRSGPGSSVSVNKDNETSSEASARIQGELFAKSKANVNDRDGTASGEDTPAPVFFEDAPAPVFFGDIQAPVRSPEEGGAMLKDEVVKVKLIVKDVIMEDVESEEEVEEGV